MPSFTLIHPTVWPQYTNVTDRTDRQDRQTDNGLIAYRVNRFTNGRPKTVSWRGVGGRKPGSLTHKSRPRYDL